MEYWYQHPSTDMVQSAFCVSTSTRCYYFCLISKTYWLKYQQRYWHCLLPGFWFVFPVKIKEILYRWTFNTKCVILLICSQMKFEAKRKVEEEKRRREMVKCLSQICSLSSINVSPDFKKKHHQKIKTKTFLVSGAEKAGGGECHPLGDPRRAGRVAAGSRRCVDVRLSHGSFVTQCPSV